MVRQIIVLWSDESSMRLHSIYVLYINMSILFFYYPSGITQQLENPRTGIPIATLIHLKQVKQDKK